MRPVARELAAMAYTEALHSLFGFIDTRIDWRRANAPLLALEAERMVWQLERAPGFLAFRKARVKTWRRRYRKHAARAWAADQLLAKACLA